MKITKITLTNFRAFKETQTIDLAPVTLLFGPNSVGKSSVLMALAYVQQILSKGHCNPQKLDALGSKTIGGFRSLVHGQDTNQSIKIRIDFEPEDNLFDFYDSEVAEMAKLIKEPFVSMGDLGGSVQCGAVEFEISWSERYQYALVKNYRVWINNCYFGCVTSSDDLKNTFINELNTQHPLLMPINHNDWLDHTFGELDQREPISVDEVQTEFEEVLNQLNPNSGVKPSFADIENANETFVNRISPVALRCRYGAIPILGNSVRTNLEGRWLDEISHHLNYLVVRDILSQAFISPLDQILAYLNKSLLIGPLRIVPNSDYVPNPHPEQADWFDGSAAWDLLYKDPNSDEPTKKLIKNTNEWFASEDKLNTGYEIINQSLAEVLNTPNTDKLNHSALLHKRQINFKELRSNILLSANQLGTGISQVLPIVVAANIDQDCLISVEQPELHIHPRFQVELADVLLQTIENHPYIIETHSEHLILRLLKRIRQSAEINMPDNFKPVKASDVSIIYLEPSENGVLVKRIRVDEDGEFQDRWPDGFFAERREELM